MMVLQCLWLIRNLKKTLKNKNNFKTFSVKNEKKHKIVFLQLRPTATHIACSVVCVSVSVLGTRVDCATVQKYF